jgi:RND family efflux transporter MFP subunit
VIAATLLLLFWGPVTGLVGTVGVPVVETARVVRSNPAAAGAVRGLAANGYVVAARRAALSADTPGRIVELNVVEGSVVKAGDVVARLYSDEYAAALRQTEASAQAAGAGLRRAEAQHGTAQAELERARSAATAAQAVLESSQADVTLAEANHARATELVSQGVLTQQDLDNAQAAIDGGRARVRNATALLTAAESAVGVGQANVKVAASDVELARAQQTVAEAAVEQARATLVKTEVRAPFDGVVVLKDAEVGEVVSPNTAGGTSARGSVVTMVDFASLEVQVDVPETSLRGVLQGGSAQIYLDAYPGEPYPGTVERIWPTADRTKATVEVRLSFARPDERLRPEMGVRVVFLPPGASGQADEPEAAPAALLIPEAALVRADGADAVFVLERGQVRLQPVEVSAREASRAAIASGLEEGERVVLDPPASLDDGDRVRSQGAE